MTELGLSPERFSFLNFAEERHFWFVSRRELVAGLLQSAITVPEPLLIDVGCGPGLNLSMWEPYANRVVGIDQQVVSADQTVAAPTVQIGEADDLPFADGEAGVVVLLDVLEHIDDGRALCEANRVLRAGGHLVVAVPAHPWLWGARDIGAHHLRRYSRRSLKATLGAAGFEIVALRPYQFLLFPAVVISRLAGKFSPASRNLEDRPPGVLNRLLSAVNRVEVWLSLNICAMPTGSSHVVLARKAT